MLSTQHSALSTQPSALSISIQHLAGDTVVDQTSGQHASHFFVMQALGDHPIEDYCLATATNATRHRGKTPRESPAAVAPAHLQVVKADQGGVAYLSSAGELIENITSGLSDEEAGHSGHPTGSLLRLAWSRTKHVLCDWTILWRLVRRLAPPRSVGIPPVQWQPRRFPCTEGRESTAPVWRFLGMPLATYGPGRSLYLLRFPGQPPFDARDVETMQMVGGLLEQGTQYEESRLLAQVNLLNRVALEAAGNPTLSRILKVALHELDRHLPFHVNSVWLTQKRSGTRKLWKGMSPRSQGPQ